MMVISSMALRWKASPVFGFVSISAFCSVVSMWRTPTKMLWTTPVRATSEIAHQCAWTGHGELGCEPGPEQTHCQCRGERAGQGL
jgi:hypothetical protein